MIYILTFFGGFLFGVLLPLSIKKYAGSIIIHETDTGGKLYSLELDGDPEDLDGKKDVRFKIGSSIRQT